MIHAYLSFFKIIQGLDFSLKHEQQVTSHDMQFYITVQYQIMRQGSCCSQQSLFQHVKSGSSV